MELKKTELYKTILNDVEDLKQSLQNDCFNVNHSLKIDKPLNRIVFGAPGTGKSWKLKSEAEETFPLMNEIFIRNSEIEKLIKKEISSKPDDQNEGDWATSIAIKHYRYFNSLEKWLAKSDEQSKNFKEFIIKLFNLKAKQPELMVSAYRGRQLLERKKINSSYERVTFHPNYSYAQFVGTYKPVQDKEDPSKIIYKYVPGPFMRVYVNAINHKDQDFLLIIEEINRANVAAVFGDVFQLLDRDENGKSEYPVAASEDIKNYLLENGIDEDELSLPSNIY